MSVNVTEGVRSVTGMGRGGAENKRGFGRRVREGAAFRKRRRTYLTLQPCHREQNTEESRG